MAITVGSIVDGVVTGITKFGAFVRLEDGTVGLVHISEVAETYVKDIADFLHEQDTVRVKVTNVSEGGKVGLSIKQARETAPKPRQSAESFEDRLAEFMKSSNEKQIDLKRHQEGRRGR